jgi:D-3-phosphoglycerate dehydrogenase / 2-oxoglutarate reductase
MRVLYYDVADKLSMGNATRVGDLRDLLEHSDVVTIHVPGTPDTVNMIGSKQLSWMKPGAFLINTSRGAVVDLEALALNLKSNKIGGAAVDVFPIEPKSKQDRFKSPIQNLPNAVLTPHIGGSTEEAQRNIGLEVSAKLIRFINNGSTEGAVNFPNVVLPDLIGHHRIMNIHRNVPGVMQKVNAMFGEAGINIAAQYLRTYEDIGYLIMDTNMKATKEMVKRMSAMPETIRVRALF